MFELTGNTIQIKALFEEKEDVIWNKFKRWGDENDKLFKIVTSKYNSSKNQIIYSGEVFSKLEIKSKGLEEIYIPTMLIKDIPEDELLSKQDYLSYVLRTD